MKRTQNAVAILSISAVLTSCNCSEPDLLIPDVESTSHQPNSNGEVEVAVGETIFFDTNVANYPEDPEDDCEETVAIANLLGSIVKLFVNGNEVGTADYTYDTPELESGGVHTQPNGLTFQVPGEYDFQQAADYTNLVSESDESNNWLVVFDFLEWVISLFGKDDTGTVVHRIIVKDPMPLDAKKQEQYDELIRTGKFVRFQ